ncbi:MAG: hypothetical protein KAV87_12990 [Desulfobacteraceae bacterium]|nr:hypothetical protein [Desulfobacteraceae bacterium]
MARSLTNNEVAQFDAEVKQAYQKSSILRGAVRVKTGVVGATHQFPTFGKGLATPRLPQTDVIPMNIQQDNVVATLEDWNAPEYTDIFDQQKVNYSERAELATTIAMAIGRRQDQLILDALAAGVAGGGIAGTSASSAMTVAKLTEISEFFDDQGVPESERHLIWSPRAKRQILADTQATSADFASIKALVNGKFNEYMGFTFHMIETRVEGGLVKTVNDRACFAFHGGMRGSLGLAVGIDFRSTVDWIAEKTSWLSNGLFSAGSIVIDPLGIVSVIVDET